MICTTISFHLAQTYARHVPVAHLRSVFYLFIFTLLGDLHTSNRVFNVALTLHMTHMSIRTRIMCAFRFISDVIF